MAGIVFGLGVTAAACHLPRVPEHRRGQHRPVPDRLGDRLVTAEEPECEPWQAHAELSIGTRHVKGEPFLVTTQIGGSRAPVGLVAAISAHY